MEAAFVQDGLGGLGGRGGGDEASLVFGGTVGGAVGRVGVDSGLESGVGGGEEAVVDCVDLLLVASCQSYHSKAQYTPKG